MMPALRRDPAQTTTIPNLRIVPRSPSRWHAALDRAMPLHKRRAFAREYPSALAAALIVLALFLLGFAIGRTSRHPPVLVGPAQSQAIGVADASMGALCEPMALGVEASGQYHRPQIAR